MSLISFFIIQPKCHDSHFQWSSPPILPAKLSAMFSPTYLHLLLITPCFFYCQAPNPTVWEASLCPFIFSHSTLFPDPSIRPHYTSIPSGFNSPLLATPCAPRGYLPPSSPHTSGLWPRLPPPKGRRREKGEKRGGTPQGRDDLPLVSIAANHSFLLSYWSGLVRAPPSSSDRPGHRLSAPVQHSLGGETLA